MSEKLPSMHGEIILLHESIFSDTCFNYFFLDHGLFGCDSVFSRGLAVRPDHD
jgi:hypothetical protein